LKALFCGNARLLVLGELAEKEGDPHGEEDEELRTQFQKYITSG